MSKIKIKIYILLLQVPFGNMTLPLAQEHASEPLASFVFTDHSGQRQTWVPFGYGKQKNIQPPFDGPLHGLEPLKENKKRKP